MLSSFCRRLAAFALLGLLGLLGACSHVPVADPRDPLESFNRDVYRFNEVVDGALVRPVATVYRDHVPDPMRTGVSNFFGNLRDFWSFLNAGLQLRPREAVENLLRFQVNTFLGFGGVLDIASEMGIERTRLDFGQTLGRWGVPTGPYLVLPLLGPSNLRDAMGIGVETRGDLLQGLGDAGAHTGLTALRVVDARANLLRATEMLDGAALDPYSFVRDVSLQRRAGQIGDLIDKGIGLGN